jgi:hypothetical protein
MYGVLPVILLILNNGYGIIPPVQKGLKKVSPCSIEVVVDF